MSGLINELEVERRLPPLALRKALRVSAGVSQQRLADELRVHRITVARWELGRRTPRGEHLRRYVSLLEGLREISS